MGCGSSAPVAEDAPVARPAEPAKTAEPKPDNAQAKVSNTVETDKREESKSTELADRLEGAAEMAAVGALAGAAAAATVTAVVNSENLSSAPEDLAKVTGEALLEMAKTVPFVAPVAYLIGAIASSAVTAVTLKADCVEFGKIVQMLENILLKAQNLESHEEVVQDVKESLEEGLILMQKMQDRGIIAATFLAKSDKSRFEDLRVRIEQAINRLNLSVTVDTAVITKAKFQQSEELRKKIEDLGGLDVVESDPDAAKQLQDMMEASDQVLNANIVAARKTLKVVGDEVMKTNSVMKTIEEQQREQMKQQRETRKSVLKTEAELKKMTESFMEVQASAQLQQLQNDFLKRQVDELKSMLSEVKDCMTKFPQPVREPERLLVVNNGGFMNLTPDDETHRKVKEVCMEATRRWGVICQATILDDLTQFTSCGFMPPSLVEEVSKEPVECAIDLCGICVPRKVGMCQHVIAKEEPIIFMNTNGKDAEDNLPPETTFEDLQQATKSDARMKEFMQRLESGEMAMEWEGKDEATKKILNSYLEGIMTGGDFFYSGIPVNVQKRSVGAFCLLGIKKPDGWSDSEFELQKQMTARVEMALEQHLQQKQNQAQQAMMLGLMQQQAMMQQMQQQQQGGMQMMPNNNMMMPNVMMPNMMMMQQQQQQQQQMMMGGMMGGTGMPGQ